MTTQDLRRVLVLGRTLTASVDRETPTPRVWLLDEVSAILGWSAILKGARDNTDFGDDTVVATGSRWAEGEDIEGNLMAGRAGSGTRRWRTLYPMSFREFTSATAPELGLPDRLHPAELQSGVARSALENYGFFVDDFDLAWQAYLTTGGFPRAVAEHSQLGAVTDSFIADLEAWLHRDVEPAASPESVPLLLNALATRSSSPFSVSSAAQELSYGKGVLDLRLRRLIASHALVRCPRREAGQIVPGAQAKYYLADPILSWLPSRRRSGLPAPDMTQLTESIIGVTQARAIDVIDEGRLPHGDTIGYVRTSNDKEIDLGPVVVPTSTGAGMTVPLESKWVDHGRKSEARTISAKFDAGILATKSVLDLEGRVWAVPAPLVALMLL